MCKNHKVSTETRENRGNELDYRQYYKDVLLMEEPFYRKGMTLEEAKQEMDYLNDNLGSFYKGEYVPLWRQNLFLK